MARPKTNSEFVKQTIVEFIADRNASILVCGSAQSEREILRDLGYKNVTFTGMDMRDKVNLGIVSKFENVEDLSYGSDAFDYAIIKDVIHHTSLPHKAITELFRVSRKGFLVFEGRDSFLIRAASKIGLTEQFEVAGNFNGHGVNGTDIPNFIFRWTEREVEKTLKSYAPQFNHFVSYRYYSNYPNGHGFRPLGKLLIKILRPAYSLLISALPKQQNIMAFFVLKPKSPDNLKPWLSHSPESDEITVNRDWIRRAYRKKLSR